MAAAITLAALAGAAAAQHRATDRVASPPAAPTVIPSCPSTPGVPGSGGSPIADGQDLAHHLGPWAPNAVAVCHYSGGSLVGHAGDAGTLPATLSAALDALPVPGQSCTPSVGDSTLVVFRFGVGADVDVLVGGPGCPVATNGYRTGQVDSALTQLLTALVG